MNRMERLTACRLYGIVDLGYTPEYQLIHVTKKLLEGGLGILQLRAKNHAPEHIERMGRQLAPLCREYGCLFIINDYPEVARSIGADGVHLGQEPAGAGRPHRPLHPQPGTGAGRLPGGGGLHRIRPPVSYGHQAGEAGDRPGAHCRHAGAASGGFSRLLHRRHQSGNSSCRSGCRGEKGRDRFLAAYASRHYGNC